MPKTTNANGAFIRAEFTHQTSLSPNPKALSLTAGSLPRDRGLILVGSPAHSVEL